MEKWSPIERVLFWLPVILGDWMLSWADRGSFLAMYHPSSEHTRDVCADARNIRRVTEYKIKKGILK